MSNDGTLFGLPPTTFTTGKFGQCADFDGATQRIIIPEPGPFQLAAGSTFTIECWLKTSDATGTAGSPKVFLGQTGGTGGWYIATASGVPFISNSGFPVAAFGPSSVADGAWHHIAAYCAGGTVYGLAVDGVQGTAVAGQWLGSSPGTAAIGALGNGGYQFYGQIDEVRVSNAIRYSGNFTPPTAALIHDGATTVLYHLDGDAAASTNDGSLVAAPTFTPTRANFGKGIVLNGSSQYVSLPDPGPLRIAAGDAFTAEAWIKTTYSGSTPAVILGQTNTAHSAAWDLHVASGKAVFVPSGTYGRVLTSPLNVNDNAWHHVAATKRPDGLICLFVDGVMQDTLAGTWTAVALGTAALGALGDHGYFFPGTIDEVRLSRVDRYSGVNFTPETVPFLKDGLTLALYHMDGDGTDSGTTIGVSDPGFFFSPNNWYSDGGGAMQASNVHAGSQVAVSNNPGAYFKTTFVGGNCIVNFDLSALINAGTPADYYPTVRWSIDNGPASAIYTLTSADRAKPVAVEVGPGTHGLRFEYVGGAGGTPTIPDRFNVPVQALRITGVTVDDGGGLYRPSVLPGLLETTGDSLFEGVRVNGATGLATDQDAFASPGWIIANALGKEWSNRSIGGGGWAVGGSGNTPAFFIPGNDGYSWWNKYSTGKPLLVNGKLPVIPDVWMVAYGTNDALHNVADATVTDCVQGWLTAARAAAPGSVLIVAIPPGEYKKSALVAGFAAYQGTTRSRTSGTATIYSGDADAKAFCIGIGPAYAAGLNQFGAASRQSGDGLHPLVATNALIGAAYTQAVEACLQAAPAPLTLTLTKNNLRQPVLSWVADSSAASYRVLRSVNDGDYQVLDTVPAGTLTYTDTMEPTGAIRYAILSGR